MTWSPVDGQSLVFDRKDDQGIYQLYAAQPDGSDERCLSCEPGPGDPGLDRHKGFASWHPSGKYIVTQVEMDRHLAPKSLTEPGRGASNNLWLVTADGKRWYRLTDYPALATSGTLNPRFSQDGKQLFWAEKTGTASLSKPFGVWRLAVADFLDDADGPRLGNIRYYKPGDGGFYEAQGFSPDGSRLIFSADIGLSSPYVMDIFTLELESQKLTNLTNTEGEWDEHASYSPDGKKIAFMSSRCCPDFDPAGFNILSLSVLQAEEYLMDAHGSNVVQLTYFNTPGYPEFTEEHSVAANSAWSPDGSQLAIEQILVGDSYKTGKGRRIWVLSFEGLCGAQ